MNEIHYRYWLGILVAIIVVLLTVNWGSNKGLAELLSFGLAFSSLVLAVIAIFQSLFSNASFGHVAASMTKSADEVRSAASEIKAATGDLLQRTQELPGALGNIANRFDTLQDKLLSAKVTDASEDHGKKPDVDQTDFALSHITVGGMISLYACIRALKTKKRLDSSSMIPRASDARYMQGFLTGLWSSGTIDAEFEKGQFTVRSLKNIDADRILTRIGNEDNKALVEGKATIDAYFDGQVDEGQAQPD